MENGRHSRRSWSRSTTYIMRQWSRYLIGWDQYHQFRRISKSYPMGKSIIWTRDEIIRITKLFLSDKHPSMVDWSITSLSKDFFRNTWMLIDIYFRLFLVQKRMPWWRIGLPNEKRKGKFSRRIDHINGQNSLKNQITWLFQSLFWFYISNIYGTNLLSSTFSSFCGCLHIECL